MMMHAWVQWSQTNCPLEVLLGFWWSTALKGPDRKRKQNLRLKRFVGRRINLQHLHCEPASCRTRCEHQCEWVRLRGPPDESAPLPTTFSVSWTRRRADGRCSNGRKTRKRNSIIAHERPMRKLNLYTRRARGGLMPEKKYQFARVSVFANVIA